MTASARRIQIHQPDRGPRVEQKLLHLLATSVSAPDISDYDEAPAAVADFVRHTRSRTLSPELRDALAALAECPYLESRQAAACRKRLAEATFDTSAPAPETFEEVPSAH